MENKFENFFPGNASKGGLIGTIIGALLSSHSHRIHDSSAKKAGKTAVFTGLGYLLGALIDKKVSERNPM